jgi:hypothetical protein
MYELKGVGWEKQPSEIPRAETRIPAFRRSPLLGRAVMRGSRGSRRSPRLAGGSPPARYQGISQKVYLGDESLGEWGTYSDISITEWGTYSDISITEWGTYSDISITEWGLEETPASELI